jgi:hypothetical protein
MNFNNPKKLQSRIDTIITPYTDTIGECLPKDKQYWTMCANCTIPGCELDQMTKASLISPKQFMGVDIDPETISLNKEMESDATFIQGDFFNVMSSYSNFNPGVVNMDCLNTFETEKIKIKRIFFLLQRHSKLLFNINVLLGNHNVAMRNPLDFISFFYRDIDMASLIRSNKWETSINTYVYKGLGGNTKMMSIGLLKT